MKRFSNWPLPLPLLLLTAHLLLTPSSFAIDHDPFVDPKANCSITQQLSTWRVIGLIGNPQQGWRGWLVNAKGEWLMVETGQPLLQDKAQVARINSHGIALTLNPAAHCATTTFFLPLLWQSKP